MSDIELVKACALAMGYHVRVEPSPFSAEDVLRVKVDGEWTYLYRPLTDDAQAMALVKRFGINLMTWTGGDGWIAQIFARATGENADLNRAICLCIANMKARK